jgi:hypothetical protein
MEKCKIVVKGNTSLVLQYNNEYDRTLYCYFENKLLKAIDFIQGNEVNNYDISKVDIVHSDCNMLWRQICDNREDFVSNIYNIEQALHLALHISEVYCNFYVYSFKDNKGLKTTNRFENTYNKLKNTYDLLADNELNEFSKTERESAIKLIELAKNVSVDFNKPITETYFVIHCDDRNRPSEIKTDMYFESNEIEKLSNTLSLLDNNKLNYDLLIETFNNEAQEIEKVVYLVSNNGLNN